MKRLIIEMLLSSCAARHLLTRILPSRTVLWCASSIGAIAGKFCLREEAVSVAQLRYAFPDGLPKTLLAAAEIPVAPQESGEAVPVESCSNTDPFEVFRKVAKKVFRHVGEGAGELLVLEDFLRSRKGFTEGEQVGTGPLEIASTGDDIIEDLLRSGSGAVGLSAHLGSFELLAAHLAGRGLKCSVIGRAPNYPSLEKVIREFRLAYGVEVIWSNATDAPRQLVTAVRSGRIICALIDQDTKWKSDFSSFFGLEAASPIAPIQVAMRYRLPLFSSFIVRTAPMSHQVTTEVIPYVGDDPLAISSILALYNQRLERLIRLYPDQYIWWHRRWRRRPGIDYSQSPQLLKNTSLYKAWLDAVPPREPLHIAAKK